jgi:hypothetical protein
MQVLTWRLGSARGVRRTRDDETCRTSLRLDCPNLGPCAWIEDLTPTPSRFARMRSQADRVGTDGGVAAGTVSAVR